jgi:hypothetical protein
MEIQKVFFLNKKYGRRFFFSPRRRGRRIASRRRD